MSFTMHEFQKNITIARVSDTWIQFVSLFFSGRKNESFLDSYAFS